MDPAFAALERTGEKFNLNKYLHARDLCKAVVTRIAANVVERMNEADGQQLIKEEFKKEGVSKFWHPSKFRVGSETLKSFRELPDQGIWLAQNDVFLIDVGPIIDDHEADYGQTFVLKDVLAEETTASNGAIEFLATDAETVWRETARKWHDEKLSGQKLYEAADTLARTRGYRLNPNMAGHRLGDFPHALFTKEGLATQKSVPSENIWVLEIHIISDTLKRGAFYEDILTLK